MKKIVLILALMLTSLTVKSQTAQENDSLIASVIVNSMNNEPENWVIQYEGGCKLYVNNETKIRFTEPRIYDYKNIAFSAVSDRMFNVYKITTYKFVVMINDAKNNWVAKKELAEYKRSQEAKAKEQAEVVSYFKELSSK